MCPVIGGHTLPLGSGDQYPLRRANWGRVPHLCVVQTVNMARTMRCSRVLVISPAKASRTDRFMVHKARSPESRSYGVR